MSLTTTLGTALSGLRVNQRAIEVASHNVANAQTVGYSRQTVDRSTVVTAGTGGGVSVAGVVRAADSFVTAELRSQTAGLGEAEVRDRYLSQIDDMFGRLEDDNSLAANISKLGTAAQALANAPDDTARQQALAAAAAAFATGLNQTAGTVQSLRGQADQEITGVVATVNADLATVADLNARIARGKAQGDSTADLQDQRDTVISRIGASLDIRTFERATGEIAVYAGDGTTLVDRTAAHLDFTAGQNGSYGAITVNGKAIDGGIGSGTLRGLLDLRDNVLPDITAQLDALGSATRDRLNAVHNRGTAIPAPSTLTGTRSIANVDASFVTLDSPVRVATLDGAGKVTAYTDIPAGRYSVAGLRDAINAGLPGKVTASAQNGGLTLSASVAGQGVAIVDLASGGDATVTYEEGSRISQHTGLSSFFGLNDLFTGSSAKTLAMRSDVAGSPSLLARGRLSTAATLTPGTSIGVTSGDATNATALSAAITATGTVASAGGLGASNTSLGGYAGQIIASNASLASAAAGALDARQATVDALNAKAASVSGVSIDEEMASLIAFQNAYAASARVVSVVQQMFDTLSQMVR